MPSVTQDSPTGELRFLRKKDGKAILQQRWRRSFVPQMTTEEAKRQSFFVCTADETWWQDVPMVSPE